MAERTVARLAHGVTEQEFDFGLRSTRIVHAAISHTRPICDQYRNTHARRVGCTRITREKRLWGREFRRVRDLRGAIYDGLIGNVEDVEQR